MTMYSFKAFDAGEFNESDHPRDNDGKFSTSGGGGAGSASAPVTSSQVKEFYPSYTIKGVMSQYGFKKIKQPDQNKIVYRHPSGLQVTVHPDPKQKKSHNWSLAPKGGAEQHGMGEALEELVKKHIAGLTGPSQSTASAPPQPYVAKPYTPGAGFPMPPSPTPAPKPAAIPPTSTGSVGETLKNTASIATLNKLVDQGYKTIAPAEGAPANSVIIKKDNNKVQYNFQTQEWIVASPGYSTKEGVGGEALEKLLFGPKVFKEGEKPPWKVSSKTIQDPQASQEQKEKQAEQTLKKSKLDAQHDLYKNVLKDAAPQPTTPQQSAISHYTGSGYSSMNQALRHDPSFAKDNPKVKHLDAYLDNAALPTDVTVYRKVSGEYAKIVKSIIMEGAKFVDKGFISTSGVEEVWHGSMKMVINCKKGQKGAAVSKWSSHPSEYEVILPRNSAFLVTKIEGDVVHCELDQSHFGSK